MRNRTKFCDSTIPFLGGKRKMSEKIISKFQGDVVADIFMGGGSVSLNAKRANMLVIANDIAYRSKIVGEALISNKKEKLTDEDVYGLFLSSENDGFIRDNYVPKIFTLGIAEFLDLAFVNARKRVGFKRELLLLLLVKYIFSLRQFGSFQVGRQDNEMILAGKERELLELASESRGKKILHNIDHPLDLLLKLKDKINMGVYDNGKENKVYQMDCFDFLRLMKKKGVKIDTAYFDSPYYNSTVYSKHYRILDEILQGEKNFKIEDMAFNKKDVLDNFEELFALSEFIPKWVISMGFNPTSNSGIKGKELLAIVQKFRKAELHYMEHNWAINNIASKSGKKQGDNVEYLIVTR